MTAADLAVWDGLTWSKSQMDSKFQHRVGYVGLQGGGSPNSSRPNPQARGSTKSLTATLTATGADDDGIRYLRWRNANANAKPRHRTSWKPNAANAPAFAARRASAGRPKAPDRGLTWHPCGQRANDVCNASNMSRSSVVSMGLISICR